MNEVFFALFLTAMTADGPIENLLGKYATQGECISARDYSRIATEQYSKKIIINCKDKDGNVVE